MRLMSLASVLLAGGLAVVPVFARSAVAQQMNEQARERQHAEAKADEHADNAAEKTATGEDRAALKAQAKADHATRKALGSRKMKKATRAQDEANEAATKAVADKL